MNTTSKLLACLFACALAAVLAGCASGSGSASASAPSSAVASSSAAVSGSAAASLDVGTYIVKVDTDSSMFHINESKDGTGELTVTNDGMTVHIALASKKITKLYAGTVEQAKADPDGVIDPTNDMVTYSDGTEEEVYGFDVPVPALDEEFNVAILGSKGNWYDHKVTVSNPVKI